MGWERWRGKWSLEEKSRLTSSWRVQQPPRLVHLVDYLAILGILGMTMSSGIIRCLSHLLVAFSIGAALSSMGAPTLGHRRVMPCTSEPVTQNQSLLATYHRVVASHTSSRPASAQRQAQHTATGLPICHAGPPPSPSALLFPSGIRPGSRAVRRSIQLPLYQPTYTQTPSAGVARAARGIIVVRAVLVEPSAVPVPGPSAASAVPASS